MRKRMYLAAVVAVLAIVPATIHATQDCVDVSEQWLSGELETRGPIHEIGHFDFPAMAEEDSFVTYVYTYGEILIFSYADDNDLSMYNAQGQVVWADTMQEDEYTHIQGLEPGVYKVDIPKGSSVLSGDPFVTGIGTWYAVDQDSKPLSRKLLSVGPHVNGSVGHVPVLAVFSYQDNTHVTIHDIDGDTVIWEGYLDSAQYYIREGGDVPPIVYSVEANNPVSTMTGGGLGGMYIPAFNGTFTGRNFMTYQQLWSTGQGHDLLIVPWEDNTTVTVTDLNNPDAIIWEEFFPKRGEIVGRLIPPIGNGRALYIHADKDISVPQVPWVSYTAPNSLGFFLMRGMDRSGLGIGHEFFVPLEGSQLPTYPSRLHVIAFEDSTEVVVTKTPRDGGEEKTVWEGVLNSGEYYRYTCESSSEDHAVYHVTSTESVATIANCRDLEGSDFYPVITYAELLREAVTEPEIIPHSDWQVTSAIGYEITLQYANHPNGFHAAVFDASGRKVDEIHSTLTSSSITWPVTPQAPGVYFIKAITDNSSSAKVVLID